MNYLKGLDASFFHLINGVWTNPLLDTLMPALSWAGSFGVIWLVLLGAVAAFGKKTGRKIALAELVALAISFASSTLLKDLIMRPRPFLSLDEVRLLVSAPHSYAFPSGHTTSAFAAASGTALAAKKLLQRVPLWGWAMLPLAVAIAYSRIYVGVLAYGRRGGHAAGACKRLGRRPARPPSLEAESREVDR